MLRLNLLSNHFTAGSKPAQENLLEKYRKNSNIDTKFLNKLYFGEYEHLVRANERILTESNLFVQGLDTDEEVTREEERNLIMERINHIIIEGLKVQSREELYSNSYRMFISSLPVFSYSNAMSVKFGVSIVLYYKAIEILGTDIHKPFIEKLFNREEIGCFALTELGHGSNVRGIMTTAEYDVAKEEFIINTPEDMAMKFWIGGAAKTATVATVFAQLMIEGKSQGPHVFIVPLRDKKTMKPLPGLIIGDCGKKMSLDGIDNGFIIFNNFRISRDNLLNKFSQVSKEGVFTTSIPNIDSRFAVQLGSLSHGRITIVGYSSRQLGHGLKIAIRFAAMRRQFSKPGEESETPLIEYPLHQYRLFPLVASVFALIVTSNKIFEFWHECQPEIFDPKSHKMQEAHAIISSLKAISTWQAVKGLQECRESCGGLGYSYYSKLGKLRNDFDINQTWEGDNNLLLQQTAKYLIDIAQNKFKKKDIPNWSCQWIKLVPTHDDRCAAESEEELLRLDTLVTMFEHRCNLLLQKSALSLSMKIAQDKANPLDAWNNTQVFNLNSLAKAFGELVCATQFSIYIKKITKGELSTNKDTKEALTKLFQLYCLSKVETDLGTFRENDYMSSEQGDMVKTLILKLCGELKRHIVPLVDSFYPGEELLDSFIAPTNGDLYGSITNKLYSAPKTFERASNWSQYYSKMN